MSIATAVPVSDDQLATRAAAGDESAFAELYQRHSAALYDFVLRTVRDADAAEDVVQSTFVKAWDALPALRDTTGFRSWLFTIARNRAIDECRRRRRLLPFSNGDDDEDDDREPFALIDPDRTADPEASIVDSEVAELVWTAAAALTPTEYTLLDLHLRQGFEADELAGALGVSKGNVYVMLTRLRHALGESVAVLLLARRGSRDCTSLAALLSGFEGRLDRARKTAIQRHINHCDECRERTRRFVAPAEIFGSFAPVGFAAERSERTWAGVQQRLRPRTAITVPNRFRLPHSGTNRMYLLLGAIVVVLLGAILAGVALTGDTDAPWDPADVRSTSHRPGEATNLSRVTMVWTAPRSATGYSFHWDAASESLPDTAAELSGDAGGVTSSELAPGAWYFHMRTQGKGGKWTSTVHAGPFIVAAAREPSAASEPTATATLSRATATASPTATLAPEATGTASATSASSVPPPTLPAQATATATSSALSPPTATESPRTPVASSPTQPFTPTSTPPAAATPTPTRTATATPQPTAPPDPPTSIPPTQPPPPTPTPPAGPTEPVA